MTWIFDIQQPVTGTAAVGTYRLKAALIARGWTVPSSSDGTTYNSSGDQISSGAAGANGLGNANAWFRIKCPVGTREFVFQRISAAAWRIKYSVAGFTAGSPSATRVPSATDEVVIIGGGTDAAPTGFTWGSVDATAQKWNVITGDATEGYSFTVHAHAPGSFTMVMGLTFDLMEQANASDLDPYAILYGTSAFAYAYSGMQSGDAAANGNGGRFWYKYDVAGITRVWVASTADHPSPSIASTTLGPNPFNGKDEIVPVIYWRSLVPTQGFKGISRIFKQGTVFRATGDGFSLNSTRDLVCVQGTSGTSMTLIPWDGSIWVP